MPRGKNSPYGPFTFLGYKKGDHGTVVHVVHLGYKGSTPEAGGGVQGQSPWFTLVGVIISERVNVDDGHKNR